MLKASAETHFRYRPVFSWSWLQVTLITEPTHLCLVAVLSWPTRAFWTSALVLQPWLWPFLWLAMSQPLLLCVSGSRLLPCLSPACQVNPALRPGPLFFVSQDLLQAVVEFRQARQLFGLEAEFMPRKKSVHRDLSHRGEREQANLC